MGILVVYIEGARCQSKKSSRILRPIAIVKLSVPDREAVLTTQDIFCEVQLAV